MIGIYHRNDLDGVCSAAIMKHKYPEIQLIGYDNGEPFDITLIKEGEYVIMADISMPMNIMKEINDKSYRFIWIDHHKSSMDDYLKCDFGIQFIHYCTTKSACELTWEALFPSIETPYIIKLLSAYDIWDHDRFDWDKWTLPFQYGMRLDCENIVEKFNTNLFKINFETGNYNSLFQAIYNSGINILNYQLSENKLIIKNSFVDKINGFNAICINNSSHSSLIFDNIYDDNIHDVMVLFYYKKDCWKFSIYSKKEVDCSLIAKSFNGGGHYHAAGFKVDRLNEVFTNNKF